MDDPNRPPEDDPNRPPGDEPKRPPGDEPDRSPGDEPDRRPEDAAGRASNPAPDSDSSDVPDAPEPGSRLSATERVREARERGSRLRQPPGFLPLLITSAVITVLGALYVGGYIGVVGGTSGLGTAVLGLLASLFVLPWVFANLALLRLVYCVLTGQSPAIRVTKTFELGATATVWATVGLWGALFVAREFSSFDFELYQQSTGYQWSSFRSMRDDPSKYEVTFDEAKPRQPLVKETDLSLVDPRGGNFERGFRDGFSEGAGSLHHAYVDISVDANPPLCYTPLVKFGKGTANGEAVFRFELEPGRPEIRYEVKVDFEYTVRRYGLSSCRSVHEEMGETVGRAYAKSLTDIVEKERGEAREEG